MTKNSARALMDLPTEVVGLMMMVDVPESRGENGLSRM